MLQIRSLLYRQEQKINEDLIEVKALFRVTKNGRTGWLLANETYEGRDGDSTYFCDVRGVTLDDIEEARVDEKLWELEPKLKLPNAVVDQLVKDLTGREVTK